MQRLDPDRLGGLGELHRAVDAVVIGEREGLVGIGDGERALPGGLAGGAPPPTVTGIRARYGKSPAPHINYGIDSPLYKQGPVEIVADDGEHAYPHDDADAGVDRGVAGAGDEVVPLAGLDDVDEAGAAAVEDGFPEQLAHAQALARRIKTIGGTVPGSLSLILADHWPWHEVFWFTGTFMLPGMLMAWWVSEPKIGGQPKSLREAVKEPFQEFWQRQGWQGAATVLGFIFFYKLGDSLCTALATPFYLDMGFSKTDIGLIAKHAGLWPAVIGALFGGLWMLKLGINRALWLFGLVQLFSIFGFAWLASQGQFGTIGADERLALAGVIGLEAFGVGLGTAAFVAFIARSTHPAYTATQMALFTSLAAVPRTFVNASAGWLVEQFGWLNFFWLCAVLAIPCMLLLLWVAPWQPREAISQH